MKRESLINKYFENSLSEQERIEFDKLIAADETFRNEVEFRTDLKEAITNQERQTIKKELIGLESGPLKSKFKMWPFAASIVLLLGVSAFWFFSNSSLNSQELFDSYFTPCQNVTKPIERGSTHSDQQTLAFMAYEQGDYTSAIELFSKLYDESNESYYLFYKANALLELEKAEQAVSILSEHLKTEDTLSEKTNWYLALAYLKLNNKEQAIRALNDLISDGKYKTKEAKELLKKIK